MGLAQEIRDGINAYTTLDKNKRDNDLADAAIDRSDAVTDFTKQRTNESQQLLPTRINALNQKIASQAEYDKYLKFLRDRKTEQMMQQGSPPAAINITPRTGGVNPFNNVVPGDPAGAPNSGVMPRPGYVGGGNVQPQPQQQPQQAITPQVPMRTELEADESMLDQPDQGDELEGAPAPDNSEDTLTHDEGQNYALQTAPVFLRNYGKPSRATGRDSGNLLTPELRRQINPEGKLTDGQTNLFALGYVKKHFDNLGNSKKSEEAGAALLGEYYRTSKLYHDVAAKCLEDGNLQGATAAMAKAYGFVPNGLDLQCKVQEQPGGQPIIWYRARDEKTGATTFQGSMTPEELFKQATNFTPEEFTKELQEAHNLRTGKYTQKPKKEQAIKPMSLRDRVAAGEAVDPEVDKQLTGYSANAPGRAKEEQEFGARRSLDAAEPGDEVGPVNASESQRPVEERGTGLPLTGKQRVGDDYANATDTSGSDEVKHITAQVFAANPNSKGVATNIITKLAGTNSVNDSFKLDPQKDGGMLVTDKGGRSIVIPKDAFRQLAALRTSNNWNVAGLIGKSSGDVEAQIGPEVAREGTRRKLIKDRQETYGKRERSPGREMVRRSKAIYDERDARTEREDNERAARKRQRIAQEDNNEE